MGRLSSVVLVSGLLLLGSPFSFAGSGAANHAPVAGSPVPGKTQSGPQILRSGQVPPAASHPMPEATSWGGDPALRNLQPGALPPAYEAPKVDPPRKIDPAPSSQGAGPCAKWKGKAFLSRWTMFPSTCIGVCEAHNVGNAGDTARWELTGAACPQRFQPDRLAREPYGGEEAQRDRRLVEFMLDKAGVE